jgi:hypothetical protein
MAALDADMLQLIETCKAACVGLPGSAELLTKLNALKGLYKRLHKPVSDVSSWNIILADYAHSSRSRKSGVALTLHHHLLFRTRE